MRWFCQQINKLKKLNNIKRGFFAFLFFVKTNSREFQVFFPIGVKDYLREWESFFFLPFRRGG